jgi:methionyl-tRNA formyltransferase
MMVSGARIKVLRCAKSDASGVAGIFIDAALTLACGSGAISCLELQREGKGAMPAEVFLRGFPVPAGTRVS